jgi:hypothetical protein
MNSTGLLHRKLLEQAWTRQSQPTKTQQLPRSKASAGSSIGADKRRSPICSNFSALLRVRSTLHMIDGAPRNTRFFARPYHPRYFSSSSTKYKLLFEIFGWWQKSCVLFLWSFPARELGVLPCTKTRSIRSQSVESNALRYVAQWNRRILQVAVHLVYPSASRWTSHESCDSKRSFYRHEETPDVCSGSLGIGERTRDCTRRH